MESDFPHDVCEIFRWLLIDLNAGTDPDDNDDPTKRVWPIHAKSEPDKPDNCITTYTTSGQDDGQNIHDGSLWMHYGWQVAIRAKTYDIGYTKANEIRNLLAQSYWVNVEIMDDTGTGGTTYRVESITNVGQALPLGRESGTGRYLFTINGMVTIEPNL